MSEPIDDLFITKIEAWDTGKGESMGEFDLSFLKEVTYIEKMDLSGPILMIKMHDPVKYLRDKVGLKPLNSIIVTFAGKDWAGTDATPSDLEIGFKIMTMPVNGDMVEINAVDEYLYILKQPLLKEYLFSEGGTWGFFVRKWFKSIKLKGSEMPKFGPYHAMAGTRPTKMFREMGAENGCLFHLKRSIFYCWDIKAYKNILKTKEPNITLYHNVSDPSVQQIIEYTKINSKTLVNDMSQKNYVGWDMTKGVMQNTSNTGKPIEFSSAPSMKSLKTKNDIPLPVIDITTGGSMKFTPYRSVKLVWQTDNPAAPIDESLPTKMFCGVVAHHYSAQRYFSRIKGFWF